MFTYSSWWIGDIFECLVAPWLRSLSFSFLWWHSHQHFLLGLSLLKCHKVFHWFTHSRVFPTLIPPLPPPIRNPLYHYRGALFSFAYTFWICHVVMFWSSTIAQIYSRYSTAHKLQWPGNSLSLVSDNSLDPRCLQSMGPKIGKTKAPLVDWKSPCGTLFHLGRASLLSGNRETIK